MKELVVLGFASRELAEEARSRGAELDREGVLQLDGAALAYRRDDGRVELVQPMRLAPVGAASGAAAGGVLGPDGELVVPGGHRPVPLEPVDPALHRVAQLVRRRVERRWPAALAAPGPPVGGLVVLLRDGGADAAAAQQGAVGPGAVGLVGQHPVGPGTGTPRAQARHPDAVQHRRELRGCRRAGRR